MRAAAEHIRRLHEHAKTKLPPKKRVLHVGKVVGRIMLAVAAIHFGVELLEHYNVFVHFGRTGELITGSLADYALVGSWEE